MPPCIVMIAPAERRCNFKFKILVPQNLPPHSLCSAPHQALRMDVMETLGYNSTLAEALATAHALTGSWRTIPANVRRADALTSHDIQEVS